MSSKTNSKLLASLLSSLLLLTSPSLYAQNGSLKDILRHAFNYDPRVQEAQANISMAEAQTKVSKAGHYPIVSLTGNQKLIKREHDNSDDNTIAVKAQVNLYSWGGIEASIERDQFKEDYYRYKYDETREQLGKTIGGLYLTALRAKENIAVYQDSLARHQRMLKDVNVIATYDRGRRSEIAEAESRLFQVESVLAEQNRILYSALSQLNRYTVTPLLPEHLTDPFSTTTAEQLIHDYKNKDLMTNPSYQAQLKELEGARANVKVNQANRRPAINLEGTLDRKGEYDMQLVSAWNVFDLGKRYTVDQSIYSQEVARAKLDEMLLEVAEQSRTAEIQMQRNLQRITILQKQMVAQRQVIESYELQFSIARRSLLDVLNAHQELTSIAASEVAARSDFRDAALAYLVAQAQMVNWSGLGHIEFPVNNK